MRSALDKLRSVLVALVHDGHTSAALLRSALDDLEREDAARRDFDSALRSRAQASHAARDGELLAEVVHLTADGARLADEVVRAAHPDSENGRDVSPAERQRLVAHADAVRRRLGVVLPMLHATGKRGAA